MGQVAYAAVGTFVVNQSSISVSEGEKVTVNVSFNVVEEQGEFVNFSCSETLTFSHGMGDSATFGVDYSTSDSEVLLFNYNPDGSTNLSQTQSITYLIELDGDIEPDEIISTTISRDFTEGTCEVNGSLIVNNITIVDLPIIDTAAPTVTIGNATVDEGAGTVTVPVTIDTVILTDVVVIVVTTTGTAGTEDFTETVTRVTIPVTQTSAEVVISITEDLIDEPDETFTVDGTVVSENTLNSNPSGTVTITDNDVAPTVTIGDATVDEGAGTVSVPVTIDTVTLTNVVVNVVTTTGTAGTEDYTETVTQVTIPETQTSAEVVIPITEDAIDEPDETFTVNGTVTSDNTSNTNPSGTVTILDNDTDPPDFLNVSLELPTVIQEGSGIVSPANLIFSLVSGNPPDENCNASAEIKVTGTAESGIDFTLANSSFAFGVGDPSTKTIPINLDILAGTPGDGDKTIELEAVFESTGGIEVNSCPLADSLPIKRTITITDDPFEAPVISLSSDITTLKEGETIQVKLEIPSIPDIVALKIAARSIDSCEMSATWDYAAGPENAIKDVDYTFVSPPDVIASSSGPISIELKALTDTGIEGNENIDIGVTLKGLGDCSSIPETRQRIVLALVDANDISSPKPEPEDLLTDSCRVLGTRTARTVDEQSFFESNCVEGEDISRNFEPEEISAQTNAVLGGAERQLRNVRSRLDKLQSSRGQQRGIDVSGVNISLKGTTFSLGMLGGGAGDENDLLANSRWSLFANGEYAFGKKNRGFDKELATGDRNFDFNSKGLTIGADYRFPGEKLIAGAALGYKDFDSDFTSQEGNTNTTGINVSMYGTYLLSDKAYLDGVIGLGKDSIKSRRPVNNDGTDGIGDQTTFAIGNPDAQEYTFSVGGGYEINKREWTFNPYGRLDYTKGTIDKYKEISSHSSARTSMFEIDKQSIESLTSSIGIKTSRVYSTSKGVFIPFASLEWKHEFKGRGAISGQSLFLQENPDLGVSPGFSETQVSDLDKNYYNIGAGISAVFPKGRSAFLNIESRLGDTTIKDNAIRAGYRWEF